jgi:hypothetical protein
MCWLQLMQVCTGVTDLTAQPSAPVTPYTTKVVALLGVETNQVAAKEQWRRLGLGRAAVLADLKKVRDSSGDFDFTDGLLIPHLWTALRPITFGKTSNRR